MELPRWLTKANFVRLQSMDPEAAMDEAERLRAEFYEKAQLYRAAHAERRRELAREYYKAHRKKILKKMSAYHRKRRPKLMADPDWLEKERARGREKAKRQWREKKAAGIKKPRTEAAREKDRRKRRRMKMQDLAHKDPQATRKMIADYLPGYLVAAASDDVIAAVMADALARKIEFNRLGEAVKAHVAAYNRQFDYFKTISIDAPIAGTDDLTRADLIDSEAFHF